MSEGRAHATAEAVSDSDDPAEPAEPIEAASVPAAVATHPETAQHRRILEALLFAAAEPLDEATLKERLPQGVDVAALIGHLQALYAERGVNLVSIAGKWTFRTAADLAFLLRKEAVEQKRLSRAAMETLAIIAYHQPVTRAEIEDIRGVSLSKGSLDILLEIGWAKPRGRRKTPGRPLTFGTTEAFASHFGLASLADLPGLDDLKAAGLLESAMPADFRVPSPQLDLQDDEEPLEEETGDSGPDGEP
ncbi:MAG: SMC-Scp complex subunit ScpB [Alphaproteobacteria bacterium]|nr:SMC-Scp complex subunit ScpB [Alphaproteobacteria bacterium]